jgi:hypothetical protein
MKNLIIIFLSIFCLHVSAVHSQTKKITKKVTVNSPVKKKVVVQPTQSSQPTKVAPPHVTQKPVEAANPAYRPSSSVKSANRQSKASGNYKAAIGLKFIYGISVTGKVFLKERSALEGILRYNGAGGLGANIAFSGLYEHHNDIKAIDGLRWYIGGGGHVNYLKYDNDYGDPVTSFGIVGIVGLEYKIQTLPIAISADWQPGYIFSNGAGFSAENGGIGIKYTF